MPDRRRTLTALAAGTIAGSTVGGALTADARSFTDQDVDQMLRITIIDTEVITLKLVREFLERPLLGMERATPIELVEHMIRNAESRR